eukprot:2832961-Prymnesium_polylepis.2
MSRDKSASPPTSTTSGPTLEVPAPLVAMAVGCRMPASSSMQHATSASTPADGASGLRGASTTE